MNIKSYKCITLHMHCYIAFVGEKESFERDVWV